MKGKELIKLEHLSILEINGKGSFELLQGQITSDMEKSLWIIVLWDLFAILKAEL